MSGNNNTQQRPDPSVLQRLSSTGHPVSNTNDDTNPILLEAKLLELITSIRQLISSNQQLEQALNEDDDEDDDLLQALIENEELILRKKNNAMVLADTLKSSGVNISLNDKIPLYHGSVLIKKMKEDGEDKKSKNGNNSKQIKYVQDWISKLNKEMKK